MRYKFKINDVVQYKTQKGFFEPCIVTARGYIEGALDKQNIYNLQNSVGRIIQVCEDLLKEYEKDKIK